MNEYERQREDRISRLRERAEKKRKAANSRGEAAFAMALVMQGEPVKVGHHSERRHRRDLERIDNNMRKAAELTREAERLSQRAASAEDNDAVASHDPEALDKLREKMAGLLERRQRIKEINKAHRSMKDIDLTGDERKQLDSMARYSQGIRRRKDGSSYVCYPPYVLSNLAGQIKQVQDRIDRLEAAKATPEREPYEGEHGEVVDNPDRAAVEVHFMGKPDEAIRTALKAAGFRWSKYGGYWYARRTTAAWDEACRIVREGE